MIITGAQTGVDTAAIRATISVSLPYTGWVPQGFTNEAGLISPAYIPNLHETPSTVNSQRTEWNMRDADVVLTILRGPSDRAVGGTKLGVDIAERERKEMCFVDLTGEWETEVRKVRGWLEEVLVGDKEWRLAIGGPRESEEPGIEGEAERFLVDVLGDL